MFRIILTIGSIQVLAIAVNLIRTKAVAVMLGPEGVGVVSLIDQVVQSVSYFSALSLPFASIKFLSKAHSEGEKSFRRTYVSFLNGLFVLAVAGATLASFAVFFWPELFGNAAIKYRLLLSVGFLGVPGMVLGGYFSQVLAAAQKYRQSSVLAVITNFATTAAIFIGIAAAGLFGLYLGIVAAGVVVIVGVLIYLRKSLKLPIYEHGSSFISELRHNPSIISFSFLMYVTTLTYSLGFLVVRYAILKNYGEAEAGLLQAAVAVSLAISAVLVPANGLYLTPAMNRNTTKDEKADAAIEFKKKLTILLGVVSILVVLFPELILTVLFSTKFVPASQFVFLFVTAQMLLQLSGVNQALLIGLDDLKGYAVITSIGQISFGALSWILAPYFGIFGVGISFVAGYSFVLVASSLRLKLSLGVSIPRRAWALTLYSLCGVIFWGTIFRKYNDWNALVFAAKTIVGSLFILGFLFSLEKEQRLSLHNYVKKRWFGRRPVSIN